MPVEPSVDTGKLMELRFVNRLSYDQISDMVGISKSAIIQRLERYRRLFEQTEHGPTFMQHEAGILAGIRGNLLAHVADCLADNKEEVSPYQAVGMYGILFDKQRLLEGKSTANINTLTRIIELSQDSGDSALRNVTIDASQPKLPNP